MQGAWRRFAMIAVSAALVSASAAAQLSQASRAYFDGPEGFLMTAAERDAWKQVRSDAAAEQFLALFWARRDPDLFTPQNEFQVDWHQRVAAADTLFGYGNTRGAMSARGRTLLLLGMCDKWYDLPAGGSRGQQRFEQFGIGSGFVYNEAGAAQVWEYASSRFPGDWSQAKIYVAFAERNPSSGDFDFLREKRSNMHAFGLLEKAPERTITHPELTEPPRPGLLPGSLAASAVQLAWLDEPGRPLPAGGGLVVREGVFPGPRHFLWVRLVLPAAGAEVTSLVGRVRREGGGEAGSFALPSSAVAAGEAAFELAVPVAPGSWQLDLAAGGEHGPLSVTHAELATTPMPEQGTCFGPMIWGARLERREGVPMGGPFAIAGLHVEARPDAIFTPQESLSYLGHVFRPSLDEDGKTHVRSTLVVTLEGSEVVRQAPSEVTLSRLGEEVWLLGGTIPLARFARPGDYLLIVEVEQVGDGAHRRQEIPFTIVAER